MTGPSVQDGMDKAGSAVNLLWKPDAKAWTPEVVLPEYAGWKVEQHAWYDKVTIADLSFHMSDTFISGPDATKALSMTSANNYEKFAIGQAKQFVPVAEDGNILTDGILLRTGDQEYTLSGPPPAQNWVMYHAKREGLDVEFSMNRETSARRDGSNPALFRYQIQGPLAAQLLQDVLGGPFPDIKFFHSEMITIAGRPVRALRHGMAGQAGAEFIGDWKDAAVVKDALLEAGRQYGLIHQGAWSYPSASMGSGWIPSPTPAIYTDPSLKDYRQSISLFSYEGQKPLQGSFYSPDIEDYYCSPYELDYGRSISFNHDFIGREALMKAKDDAPRTKVTLVFNREDVDRVLGENPGFVHHYWRNRVETPAGALVGTTFQTDIYDPVGTVMALTLIDKEQAATGTEVEVVWGQHPGAGTDPNADLGFARLRATVHPAPYNVESRTAYRNDA
jgi:vanillate/3-O-methylgallate O-demethylase